MDDPCEAYVKLDSNWSVVAGAGLIPKKTLRSNGYDTDKVAGYAAGLGLERIAAYKFGLNDIRDLWRPSHIPSTTT